MKCTECREICELKLMLPNIDWLLQTAKYFRSVVVRQMTGGRWNKREFGKLGTKLDIADDDLSKFLAEVAHHIDALRKELKAAKGGAE